MSTPKIEETINYEKFSTLNGNRTIVQNHLNNLVRSISRKNLLHVNPIVVNKQFEVIDGQHRLAAAKQLKIAIYYVVENELSLSDVTLLNTTSKTWKLADYIDSYVARYEAGDDRFEDYVELKEFVLQTNISATVASALLSGIVYGGRKTASQDTIKTGQFKVKNRKFADTVAGVMIELSSYSPSKIYGKQYYVYAIAKLVQKYDKKKIVEEIKRIGKQIPEQSTPQGYLDYIADVTNGELFIQDKK